MPDRLPLCDDEALKRQLRREASDTRPAFSQRLHDRLRQSIRRNQVISVSRQSSTVVESLPVWLTAAILVVAASIGVVWQPARLGPPAVLQETPNGMTAQPQTFPGPSGLDELAAYTDSAVSRWDVLVDSAIASRQWAYLDEDARSALSMLADRVPVDVRFLTGSPDLASEPRADLVQSE